MENSKKKVIEEAVVKFVGDSGDGMQLTGTIFSESAALSGNDISTFPDYPAEIRAPHNTIAGVSGFQAHIGRYKLRTTGDLCDILVAMNPASLKANLKWAKKGGTLIVDSDTFDEKALGSCNYQSNPLEDGSLKNYSLIKVPMSSHALETGKKLNFENKVAEKSKNMYALGIISFLFNSKLDILYNTLDKKFSKKPEIAELNKKVLEAGYKYAQDSKLFPTTYEIPPAEMEKGRYRNVTGDMAAAWGLIAASEKSGRPLFLGSYPITPATDIIIELAKHKSLGVKVFQAEDEIAGVCSAIGASYAGSLAVTSTSGPGFSLKSEALGLAVMTELPLVVVDVQRGGPSTGLPTKSEQSDLLQALYGRNGECPLMVMAASSSAQCFYATYQAAKVAMEHMTPVIILMDGFLANGSELFKIPKMADMPAITPPLAQPNDPEYKPYRRDEKTFVRQWALPGMEGLRHRVGGLEKEDIYGNVSTDPQNHQKMVDFRAAKIAKIADSLPLQEISGPDEGDLLVVSWGSTKGAVLSAVLELQKKGLKISHTNFEYIMPLPKNTPEVFSKFRKIVVCELNSGQFAGYLRALHPQYQYLQYNKIQGLPFTVSELVSEFTKILEEK
ncbi:MAG: 2-oxoacid:acceptor oxidoreductase subunit alpha [Bacteroidota bacterium]|nr:2-oxoacid:acceptor oxidoreductase subunit alpha [Bacteroidota bacterium]